MVVNKDCFVRLGIIILSLTIITSCTEKPSNIASSEIEVSSKITEKSMVDKYNRYVDFDKKGIKYLIEKLNLYFEIMGQNSDLIRGRKYNYGVKYRYWDEIKAVPNEQPAINELDAATKELIPVAEQLDELLYLAKEYYKAETFFKDDYAKGQELHTKILATAKKFNSSKEKFALALSQYR